MKGARALLNPWMLLLLGKRWKGCRFKHRKSTASSNPAAVLVPTRLCYECTFGALIFEIIVEGSGKYHYYAPQSRRSVKGPIYGTVLVQLCAVATGPLPQPSVECCGIVCFWCTVNSGLHVLNMTSSIQDFDCCGSQIGLGYLLWCKQTSCSSPCGVGGFL